MSSLPAVLDEPAIARAKRGLVLIAEIIEWGIQMAWGLRAVRGCIGRRLSKSSPVFAPLSRAVRLTRLLQARMLKVLKDLEAGRVPKVAAARAAARRTDAPPAVKREPPPPIDAGEPKIPGRFDEFNKAFDRTGGVSYRGDLRAAVEAAWSKLGVRIDWGRWDDEPVPVEPAPPFKDILRQRGVDAIDMTATSETAFTEHCARLDAWLERGDPRTTRGINLKHAVLRLCVIMRLAPDWSLWKDDDWVKPLVRRRDALPPPTRALE